MSTYNEPTGEQIAEALDHNCEKSGHTEEECTLACPWCGQIIGCDGYCDDVNCPNYKGGKFAEYLAQRDAEQESGEWFEQLNRATTDLRDVEEFLTEAPAEVRAKFASALARIQKVANEEEEVHS